MKMKHSLRKILPGISTYAVLIALIIIAMFQYRWVISSAETDISELYRSLTYSLETGMMQQLENYPLLENRPLFMDVYLNDDEMITEIEKVKINIQKLYGDKVVISTDYLSIDRSNNLIIYEYVNQEWQRSSTESEELSGIDKFVLRPGFNDAVVIDDNQKDGEVWLFLPLVAKNRTFITFRLDIKKLYLEKVTEFSNTILNNFEVKVYTELPENINIIHQQEYKYSPLKTIKSILLQNRETWFSAIPYHFSIFYKDPIGKKPNLRRPPTETKNDHPPMIYVDILDDGVSLIIKKENNLTLQWLLILLLIIGIGIAYVLILSQISKLKQLRLKEKEFIATITHELRTPLTVIQAASDNIKSGILKKDRVIQYGQLITDQSVRLASMIEGILLFSRLEGKAEKPPYLEEVTFSEIKQSLEIFSRSLMDKSTNMIDIKWNDLPEKAITHRETIELILTNLISNCNKHAFKDGEVGKIIVEGKISSGNSLKFKVSDNGVGIDSSEKKDIFDPFFRGKRSLKYQIKGTGLGLYLSERKANLIGGILKVDNNIDRGTVFTLQIPFSPVNEEIQE